jgi:hypothetical protein
MNATIHRMIGIALRVAIIAACGYGTWTSLELARADALFRKDTEQSVRDAIRIAPGGWPYYMRLAQLDPLHAKALLQTSLQLNRYDAQAAIELGMQYENDGDFVRAERQMLDAYQVDHTYLPRWSLANYYFRRGNIPAFWTWARSAASMPADEIGALFELCWRVSPNPQVLTAQLLNEKPEMLRQYVGFLLGKDQPAEVARIAPHLVRAGDPQSDRALLLAVVQTLTDRNDAAQATGLWRLLIDARWVVADSTLPNNGSFQREPLPVSFDWSLPEYDGLHSWPGSSGLESEFTGSEPEQCTIAEQTVSLASGDYVLNYAYHTADIPSGTGIKWQIFDPVLGVVIAESSSLSSDDLSQSHLEFTVSPGQPLLRVRLIYNRTLGTPRISGSLDVQSTQIQVIKKL